ncbi:MAG: polysaccharide deacetylase family protein [Rhodopseudomonas sp.]|uniref:polysaccharide deacetylase family protein n=1 Tax=Rhodopseudomonas sp. TaxID=1078 RepID=UPI001816A021|nr:polysaccharide deacetylase family protein [Rhodopseudomonas sp.]NVN86694.1 polysaccharide deacetylase family protein [Rhodopseudomonas sp.]
MFSDRAFRKRPRQLAIAVGFVVAIAFAPKPVLAGDCPGHPDALGTSRTLVVDPREHPRIGTMQYGETLPLQDHEVVLTFDDGPLPKYSNQVIDILAAECVKATFFIIGRMANGYPEGVRKLRAAGHTIGTHSQNHPLSMNRMSIERAQQEINDGIAATTAALGDASAVAPFFRIPGLLRAEGVEDYLASQGIQTWSADFPADDWRPISAARVYELAINRLEAKGKGILLLHDIHPRTVAALPRLLHELKTRGYRIVHVVPATPQRPATPTDPQQWQLHPVSETVAISHWPKIPSFVFASAEAMPGPGLSESDLHDGRLLLLPNPLSRARRLARGAVPLPEPAPWPRLSPAETSDNLITLPVPAASVFSIPEFGQPAITATVPVLRHAEQRPAAGIEANAALMSINISAASRPIAGSVPITVPQLRRGPVMPR